MMKWRQQQPKGGTKEKGRDLQTCGEGWETGTGH
jgi:hypothetical protein